MRNGTIYSSKSAIIIVRSRVCFDGLRADQTSPRSRRLDLRKVHQTRDYIPGVFLNAIIYTYFE